MRMTRVTWATAPSGPRQTSRSPTSSGTFKCVLVSLIVLLNLSVQQRFEKGYTMDLQLNEKTALVTGSSKGIGEAIAVALARGGGEVIVQGRDGAKAERVANAIVATGGR